MPSVQDYLDEQVRSGALMPGARVPTERALAALLGRSRHDIRNQLQVLESLGRVTRQVGRGTFLAEVAVVSPAELIEARAAWEPELLSLVAVAATADDFAEIRRCLENGDAATTHEDVLFWDLAFHRALALSTHNPVVAALHDMVEDNRRRLTHCTLEDRTADRREHREIADAVFDRNPAGARAAMHRHLQTVRRRMLSGLP
jgi:DNA-binding FadR family transcriptional regulator